MISGILRPDAGTVRVEDTDVWSLQENALADFRLHKIGFVFQDFHLFPNLTTVENVAIPLVAQAPAPGTRRCARRTKYLDVVGPREPRGAEPRRA